MKLLVIGSARHGKDTVCEIMRDKYGMSFASISEFVAVKAVYPHIMDKYGYASHAEAYADRVNHREEWRDLISAYNSEPSTLARELLECHDIYCGMRSMREFDAARHMFDAVIYVDASERVKIHDPSLDIDASVADYVIDNNGTLEQLEANVDEVMQCLNM